MPCAYWHPQYYPKPNNFCKYRASYWHAIRRQFLFKEFMVGVSSEKHAPMSMGDLQQPTTPPCWEGSSTVLLPLPQCPLATIYPCDVYVITAPFHRQQMLPQVSPTRFRGACSHTQRWLLLRGQPHQPAWQGVWLWVPGEEDAFLWFLVFLARGARPSEELLCLALSQSSRWGPRWWAGSKPMGKHANGEMARWIF